MTEGHATDKGRRDEMTQIQLRVFKDFLLSGPKTVLGTE